tara:strand:- start:768 stop:1376 length:609 start_codon:yes stop_codon:yes gene_type:complete
MKLSDLTPDPNNANKGTERGNSALEASLQQYGAGRSILLDKNDTIIAGNKTAEMAGQIGIENVRVVETAGDELVAVKRIDLDLETDASAREMAYADNRTSELSLDWDADKILADIKNGINIDAFFHDWELEQKLEEGDLEEWGGMEPPNLEDTNARKIVVHFYDESEVENFAQLIGQTITDQTKYIHYPNKIVEKMENEAKG